MAKKKQKPVYKGEVKKVAIYARISTDTQELTQQIESCERFCEYKGFEVIDVFQEVASGKTFQKRPEFYKMMVKLRQFYYHGIVVFRFDRLGRSVLEMVNFIQEMDNKGIQVFSVNEDINRDSAIGRMMFNTMLNMAQYEREAIAEATKQRLQALKQRGESLGRPVGSKDRKKRKRKYFKQPNLGGGF